MAGPAVASDLDWSVTQTQIQAPAGPQGSWIQTGYARSVLQATADGQFQTTENLKLWGTLRANLDNLPSDSPLALTADKLAPQILAALAH